MAETGAGAPPPSWPPQVAFAARPGLEDADALVVGVWQGGNLAAAARAHGLEAALGRAMAASPGFSGQAGQALSLLAPHLGLPPRVVAVGLGPYGETTPPAARLAGAEAGAVLRALGAGVVVVDLDLEPAEAAAFAFGLRLRLYQPPALRSRPDPEATPPPPRALTLRTPDPRSAEAAWALAEATAEGVELARALTHAPGNRLTPGAFVRAARALEPLGVAVEVLGPAEMAAAGLHLHLAVGRGSAHAPYLVALRWRGAPAPAPAPAVALVGKGLTFDSGGLSIKPAERMHEMKGDMAGAAAVLGTLHALARRRAPVNVTGILALAENMPGGGALRPGDVITGHAGLSVEVLDTDAEGRLVLADALSWAAGTAPGGGRPPCAVVALATLTGAIVTSLGRHRAGLFAPATPDGDALARALSEAAAAAGEAVWRMPLTPAVDEALESSIADLRQCAPAGRFLPDALHAARFLSRFVPQALPFAHLDIAGVSETGDDSGLTPAGATGFGVRLLTAWLDRR